MFGIACCDSLVGLANTIAQRSCYLVNRVPYPGSCHQIRQDFSPISYAIMLMDAPCFVASFGLRIREGLAALVTAQEGDTLSGSTRILVDIILPG